MIKYFWIVALLLNAFNSNAQTDSLEAERLLRCAKACLGENKIDSAQIYHQQALDLFQKHNLLNPWLRSYAVMAYQWVDSQNRPFVATDLIQKGLDSRWREPVDSMEWERLVMTYLTAGHIREDDGSDFAGAESFYAQAYSIFESRLKTNSNKVAPHLFHKLGNVYTRFGDYPRAENLLRQGIAYGHAHPELGMADEGDLGLLLIEIGKYEDALRIINQGLALKGTRTTAVINMLENKAAVLLAAARGDLDTALAAARRSVATLRTFALPIDLGRSLLVLGQVLRRSGERRAAKDAFDEALGLFEKHGLRLWHARTLEELRRVPIRRGAPDGLTETEARVAELAAAGRTNREIAAALFLSEKTVEANLGRVYGKLGIRGRPELGVALRERAQRDPAKK